MKKPRLLLKGLLVEIQTLEAILMRAPKEKKRDGEIASIFLENTYIIMNRILVEIWTLRIILSLKQK